MPVVAAVERQKAPARRRDVPLQCLAHCASGARCKHIVKRAPASATPMIRNHVPVPYCKQHLASGDGALRVVQHPTRPEIGKILVARFDIPKGYRMVYWGIRRRDKDCTSVDKEDHTMCFYPTPDDYNGNIDPSGTGDIMQFAGSPGPGERINMRCTPVHYGHRNGEVVGREFITTLPIKRNEQLLHWYGVAWFESRGIKRMDVGTEKYPAPPASRHLAKKKRSLADGP